MYNLSYFLEKIFFFLSLSEQVGLQEVLGDGAGSAPGRQCQGSGRFWGSGRAMVTPMEGRRGVECQTRVRRGSVHGGGLTQGVGAAQGKEGALWGAPWCSLCPDESAPMPVPYDPRTHVRLGKRHSQHTLHLRPRRSDRHLLLLYESLRGGGRVGGGAVQWWPQRGLHAERRDQGLAASPAACPGHATEASGSRLPRLWSGGDADPAAHPGVSSRLRSAYLLAQAWETGPAGHPEQSPTSRRS